MTLTTGADVLRPEELQNLGKGPHEARGLAGRLYTDPAILSVEKEKIFRREWMAVFHESTVPNPGDFRVVELAGDSLLFVRGEDGRLRGFHNICRHRGAQVAATPQGNCQKFKCPYHTWTYDLHGKLVSAPTMEHMLREGVGLVELRIDTWMGFVFVNQDGRAEPLASKLAGLDDVLEPWLSKPLEILYEIPYHGKWNWKLTYENSVEGYHVIGTHYKSAQWLAPGEMTYTPTEKFDTWTTFYMPYAPGQNQRDPTGGSVPMDNLPDWIDEEMRFFVMWPNFLISVAPENATGYIVLPGATPGEVTFTWSNIVRPETKAAENHESYLEEQKYWSQTVQGEDQYPCETMWANVHSDAFIPGPYADGERAGYHFDQWYLQRMSG
ncbi:aromatic ring-hydroxylating oxygenase subunit alpha [Streptosporangium sp. NBC_01469]|uniref:aromatic ring-hydroxylating oxygenase subunit alpha n=1 Tax=Streptosporangium sp. NBC_01469 TaxID=2903898 RepID=UPI002E2A2C0A|nr:aromatic ring-hydroxylating dioxygenase subunit alpha [Streptosporangium sp. NBC_01469]